MKKKEKAEAHLYMSLRVATDADLRLGRRSDLVKFENVREFRVKKNSTLSILDTFSSPSSLFLYFLYPLYLFNLISPLVYRSLMVK